MVRKLEQRTLGLNRTEIEHVDRVLRAVPLDQSLLPAPPGDARNFSRGFEVDEQCFFCRTAEEFFAFYQIFRTSADVMTFSLFSWSSLDFAQKIRHLWKW